MRKLLVVLVLTFSLMMNCIEVDANTFTPATITVADGEIRISPHHSNMGAIILFDVKEFDKKEVVPIAHLQALVKMTAKNRSLMLDGDAVETFEQAGVYTIVVYRDDKIVMMKQLYYIPKEKPKVVEPSTPDPTGKIKAAGDVIESDTTQRHIAQDYYLREETLIEVNNELIRNKALEIVKGKTTQQEQARAIFDWIVDNIEYDQEQVNKPLLGALECLTREKGICYDFAALQVAMCRSLGIHSVIVAGTYSKGDPHAWAGVYLDNKWKFIDPTMNNWDADKDHGYQRLGEYRVVQ